MKLSLNRESSQLLRELSASLLKSISAIEIASEWLMDLYHDEYENLGIHKSDFELMFSHILKSNTLFSEIAEPVSNLLGDTANKIDKYLGYSPKRVLSREEVNYRWKKSLEHVDTIISNYKESLISIGIPEGKWLSKKLREHENLMRQQESYNLKKLAGDDISMEQDPGYNIADYASFYQTIKNEYIDYCKATTNPKYDTGKPYRYNCQRCVPVFEMRCRGKMVSARGTPFGHDHLSIYAFDAWINPTVFCCSGSGFDEIKSRMEQWENGARAQIVIYWKGGGAHTFVAENRNGEIVFMDPQNEVADFPPSSYFELAKEGKTQFARIDNLEFSGYIKDCFVEESDSD